MTEKHGEPVDPLAGATDEALPEIELADEDILDAMRHIPGYLDISTEDFRTIYHLAHHQAVDRLFSEIRAESLMASDFTPIGVDMRMDEAARSLVTQRFKGLPVVDDQGRLCGMLTETDFLRRLQAGSFLELMLRLLESGGALAARCHETRVGDVMTANAVAVGRQAGFREITAAFHRHRGRSMPVVEADGRVCGLLLHRTFISACHLEKLP
jgi:CBS domain-containing membrane protein